MDVPDPSPILLAKAKRVPLAIPPLYRMTLVRLRFGDGTVRAVPIFGSGGASAKGVFLCFSTG